MTSYRESAAHISFTALEFHRDGHFAPTAYEYRGCPSRGWEILRDGEHDLQLGPGFTAVETRHCGVCSTDLARAALPFPLPQVTGHEVLCRREDELMAVDINASHRARAHGAAACPWCSAGLETHCPQRLTLGIDRLPGGFAPWILAPVAALHPVPADVPCEAAVFAEPFAAALRAVEVTPPRAGERVAVLGPRRLGLLVLAALATHRRRHDMDFSITALHRHPWLAEHCLRMGADMALHIGEAGAAYDIVFDTTGSPAGLREALRRARRAVHLKSTHGRRAEGMAHLTELVIDEISLHPFSASAPLDPALLARMAPRCHAGVAPSVPQALRRRLQDRIPHCRQEDMDTGAATMPPAAEKGPGGFDLALVGSLAEADRVIRPRPGAPARVRARGAILVAADGARRNALAQALARGVEIHSSRCGRIPQALDSLAAQPALARAMAEHLVTHRYPARALARAFATAARGEGVIKVVVDTAQGVG